MKRLHTTLLVSAITLALLAACSKNSLRAKQAQAEPNAAASQAGAGSAAESEKLDKIVVFGSRIKSDAQATSFPASTVDPRAQNERKPEAAAPAPVATEQQMAPPATLSPSVALVAPKPESALGENYADSENSDVFRTAEAPVSTFSVDVDTGSYTNVRRMLKQGYLPPRDAVRPEEFINYFDYGYPRPRSAGQPFTLTTELAPAPWNARRDLLLVGLQGYEVQNAQLPRSNLVFLLDVSGSMAEPNKLPLVQEALRMLVNDLDADDSVAIVVYAGAAGMVLPPTPGNQRARILEALDALSAGGSTNGGEGIQLAYDLAQQAFVRGGINRVILATDGDFNVGVSDVDALKTLVESRRDSGISLSTLGFGQGNYNDEMAEQLANIGNGNHAYIDSMQEARKVLIAQRSGTFLTIAADVKIQIEFNPAVVAEYRLIGYQNRQLNREDFDDDKKDAGEIGAGHSVTALYELCFVDRDCRTQAEAAAVSAPLGTVAHELGFLKLRFKLPGQTQSELVTQAVARQYQGNADRIRFAGAVAGFADRLRGDGSVKNMPFGEFSAMAASVRIADPFGYRAELVALMARAEQLSP